MNIQLTLVSAFLVFVLIYLIYSLVSIFKDYSVIKASWSAMSRFEKTSFNIGTLLFIAVPAFKEHPAHDYYFAKVVIEMLPAIASGFFIVGLIAFAKQLNKRSKSYNKFINRTTYRR